MKKSFIISTTTVLAALCFCVTAQAQVTDYVNFGSTGLPTGTSVSLTVYYTNTAGDNVEETYTFSSPGPGSNIAAEPCSSLEAVFPTFIHVGSDTYNLKTSDPLEEMLFCGGNTTTTTIKGEYQIEGSSLGNISTRAVVQTGDNVGIDGFIIQGTQTKRVIIRA